MALSWPLAVRATTLIFLIIYVQVGEAALLKQGGAILRALRPARKFVRALDLTQQRTGSFSSVWLELGQIDLAVWLQVRIAEQMTFDVLVQVALLREGELAVLLHGVRT